MTDDLAEYARTRDPQLGDALAVRHLPLVKFVARRMSNSLPDHIELDDLVAWGSLGLLDALRKFDPDRGLRFSTYAVTRIRGAILDGLQQMDWAPKQVTSRVRALRRLRATLTNELGTDPTVAQLAVRADVSEAEVRKWLVEDDQMQISGLPLAGQEADGEERQFEDTRLWEQELAGEISELRTAVAAAVSTLTPREQAVLTLYYRDDKTLKQVAEALGVSASSAIQAHTQLVESVRGRLVALGGVTR